MWTFSPGATVLKFTDSFKQHGGEKHRRKKDVITAERMSNSKGRHFLIYNKTLTQIQVPYYLCFFVLEIVGHGSLGVLQLSFMGGDFWPLEGSKHASVRGQ